MPIAGLRVPPRALRLKQASSSHETHTIDKTYPEQQPESYETFVAWLHLNETGSLIENDSGHRAPAHLSSIQHWRSDVEPNEYGPPKSPMDLNEFPASPVAMVHPAQLRVTSLPPFRIPHENASGSTTTLDEQDLCYLDAVAQDVFSDTSSSVDLGEHVIIPTTVETRHKRSFPVLSGLANKTVWLPRRLKYSWLSFVQRISPINRKV